jgi:putative ABC transport system permease protein
MLYWFIIKVAFKNLLANRLRSVLAMLGIIIGVAAVISMVALGAGAQKQVLDQVQAMGANLLIVRSGAGGGRGVRTEDSQTLKIEDAQAILEEVPGVRMLSPVVQGNGQFKYYNKNSRTPFLGAAATYFDVRSYQIERGRAFTEAEVSRGLRVAVLGPVTAENLFGTEDPIGETIKINGSNFEVVGVLKAKGDQGWFNPDDQAIVPFTTAMRQMLGVDYLREIDIQMADGSEQQQIQTAVEEVLRRRHRIRPDAADDFNVRNMVQMADAATAMTRTFTILVGSIAAISLLVGGIGIMNIMLVTVTERTREIGIRKAVGARDRDVLFQFLVEAVIMSGIGGVIGVGVGAGIALGIERFSQFQTLIEPFGVLIALSFSAGVGIFFGFYPARNAALLDPIEALQYE